MIETTIQRFRDAPDDSLVFVNLVDFDSEYGHRRDVSGYAAALERFDARLPELLAARRDGDLLLLTADHGNNPTWKGSDHTREQFPVLTYMKGMAPGSFGHRSCFADIGQTIAHHLGVGRLSAGKAWAI